MRKRVERESGKPFMWGWDDESVFFVHDGDDLHEHEKRIQDEPELLAAVLKLCDEYYKGK